MLSAIKSGGIMEPLAGTANQLPVQIESKIYYKNCRIQSLYGIKSQNFICLIIRGNIKMEAKIQKPIYISCQYPDNTKLQHILYKIYQAFNNSEKYGQSFLKQYLTLEVTQDFPEITEEIKQSLKLLAHFLGEKEKLIINLSRLEVIMGLLGVVMCPLSLDQGNRNLCGVDIFFRELAEKSPLHFTLLGLNLAKQGKSAIPFDIVCSPSIHTENSIVLAMMSAVRHSSNSSLTGYSPCLTEPILAKGIKDLGTSYRNFRGKFLANKVNFTDYQYQLVSSSTSNFFDTVANKINALGPRWEAFSGATLPRDLVGWFKESGFEVLADKLRLVNKDYKDISATHQFLLGGTYSSKRQGIRSAECRLLLAETIADKQKGVSGLFSPVFTSVLTENKKKVDEWVFEVPVNDSNLLLGCQYGHYMKIISFKENCKGIDVELNSLGKVFRLKHLPPRIWDQHCFGILVTQFKKPLQLQAKIENGEMLGNENTGKNDLSL
jgi:hypothetical protein